MRRNCVAAIRAVHFSCVAHKLRTFCLRRKNFIRKEVESMKKVLSVLLALCLIVGAVPMFASAVSSDWSNWEFYESEGAKQLRKYNGPGGDVVTPDGATAILGGTFERDDVSSITITEGVTSIIREAIYCPNLTWIGIPTSITYIMSNSIMCDNLKDIYYAGSEEQWHKILFDFNFDQALANQATIHFNSKGPGSTEPPAPPVGGFSDVKPDDFFADAVAWAVENGITAGVGNGMFGSQSTGVRADTMVWLWRAAGSPKVTGTNPFSDVKASDYFYDAVLWAANTGVTAGIGDGKFGVSQNCTRSQLITFLWNAVGKPEVSTDITFSDVKESDYYYKAVLWAASTGVTAGSGNGRFGSDDACLRCQAMTFLYKSYN